MWIEAISGGGVTPTPITPSNTTPASMTSGTAYEPTANGYAIENYDSVTPSSTPASVASGDIVKIGGSGVIVDSIPTPTSITPSNSSPVSLTANTPVKPTANGYAISSYSSLTPSSTPANISSGSIYKAGGSGYAIDGYVTVTPTTSGIYFTSGMKKMSTSGYAYSQQPSVTDFPEALWDTTSTTSHSFAASLTGTYILLLVFQYSTSSSLAYNRFDDTTATGATLTKIDNILTANANVAGTFFLAYISSNNVTISTGTKNSRVVSFSATI